MARQSIGVLQAYGGKWHLRCRPPYEEQNARISILVNGIAERPDTFVQTVLGQLQKPLADGAGHTFSGGRLLVGAHQAGVEHQIFVAPVLGEHRKHALPDAGLRPAREALFSRSIREPG